MIHETDEELEAAADRLLHWRTAPEGILDFVRDSFGAEPDPWQRKALLAFADKNKRVLRIALQACVGPGKTAVLAWCAWWFMVTQCDEENHPRGLATAITGDNLKGNLWSELAHWQGKSAMLMQEFTWTASAIFHNEHPATWRIEARSWPKTASAEQQGQTFSGLHAKYVLVLIDESGNIPPPVLRAAEQAMSICAFGRILQAGNPTSREGMLYAAAYPLRKQWFIIRITGDPDDPEAWTKSPRLASLHQEGGDCACPLCWAKLQIETYGRDNPWVGAQILGVFPPSSINALFDTEDLEKAIALKYRPEDYEHMQKRIGVDVARFGDDRTVIAPRQGLMAFNMKVMRNARTTDIAARVARVWNRWGSEALVVIDDTGHWGHGVVDQLSVTNIPHVALVYSAKALHPRNKNRRAEMYDEFAKWVKRGGRLPNDPELISELAALTYTLDNGQFRVIEKDQLKLTLGRSPDKADALAETFCIPDEPKDGMGSNARSGRARTMDDEAQPRAPRASTSRRNMNPDDDLGRDRARTMDDEDY